MVQKLFAVIVLLSTNFSLGSLAYGCACCGRDDNWSTTKLTKNSYEQKLIRKVVFREGTFHNHNMYIKLEHVTIKDKKYYFKTEKGNFIFELDTLIHRNFDITFITNQKYRLENVADIYHSLIYTGTLTYPDELHKQFKIKKIKARLIFQGLGNACIQASDFRKWLIKPVNSGKGYFQGSGKLGIGK